VEFGRINELDGVDLSLPNERGGAWRMENTIGKNRFGLPVWGAKSFVGPVYPPGTKAADFLRAYGQRFVTIELNATHYRMPEPERVEAWCNQVPKGFKFCPKVPQTISHSFEPNLRELEVFAERVAAFAERLGPCLLQFPDYADKRWRRTVFELTRRFPHALALELRHPSWFEDQVGLMRLVDYLREHSIGFAMTDTPGRRDVLHMLHTAPFSFVRFLGNNLHPTDFSRVDAWCERLSAWQARGMQNYFFLHQPNEVNCMPLYQRLSERLITLP
jgi:uncharacterized protein YecE (DUF72 family)